MGYVLIFVDKYRTDTGLYVYTYVSIYSKVNIHNSKKKGELQREEERERERERKEGMQRGKWRGRWRWICSEEE